MSSHPPDRFKIAQSERDVVSALRDSLRHWEPSALAQLPEKCRPGKIRDAEDIANLAFTLTTTRIESEDSNQDLVQLETLFAHACRRLSELDNGSYRGGSSDVQECQ